MWWCVTDVVCLGFKGRPLKKGGRRGAAAKRKFSGSLCSVKSLINQQAVVRDHRRALWLADRYWGGLFAYTYVEFGWWVTTAGLFKQDAHHAHLPERPRQQSTPDLYTKIIDRVHRGSCFFPVQLLAPALDWQRWQWASGQVPKLPNVLIIYQDAKKIPEEKKVIWVFLCLRNVTESNRVQARVTRVLHWPANTSSFYSSSSSPLFFLLPFPPPLPQQSVRVELNLFHQTLRPSPAPLFVFLHCFDWPIWSDTTHTVSASVCVCAR